jgi:hypothetical protein
MSENETLIVPPGKAAGCLPRRYKPGEICPMFADRIKVIPRSEWAARADEIDLQPHVKTVLDQDGVGSCAAESTTGSLMITRAVAGLPHVELNPWGLYAYTSHGRDAGSSIDENLEVARDKGIPPMALWPRSKGWSAKPTGQAAEEAKKYRIAEFFDISSVDEMVTALLLGFPVVWGANGHAICAIRHGGNSPIIVNSWGTNWQQQGFGTWATYSGINWQYGAFAVRAVEQT